MIYHLMYGTVDGERGCRYVKPKSPERTAPQNSVSAPHWKRLTLSLKNKSEYLEPKSEHSMPFCCQQSSKALIRLVRRREAAGDDSEVCVTYWLNRLQSLPDGAPDVFVTLNPIVAPAPGSVTRRLTLSHPMFSFEAYRAQQRVPSIQVPAPLGPRPLPLQFDTPYKRMFSCVASCCV